MGLGGIGGLHIEPNNVDAGSIAARSVSFGSKRPLNVVFHGHQTKFSYEFFGIHQGTEDRLTFVGDAKKSFTAEFIDCRKDSGTWGKRFSMEITPSLSQCLVIPPGVAHIFDGLEDVFTINSFKNFLPPPDEWVSGLIEWNIAADTVNIHRDTQDQEIPKIRVNSFPASDLFYHLTSENIERSLDGVVIEYPFTHAVKFDDGSSKTLKFRKNLKGVKPKPKRISLNDNLGVCWERRLFVTGSDGDESGFTTMTSGKNTTFTSSVDVACDLVNEPIVEKRKLTIFGDPSVDLELSIATGDLTKKLLISPTNFYDLVVEPGVSINLSGPATLFAVRVDAA